MVITSPQRQVTNRQVAILEVILPYQLYSGKPSPAKRSNLQEKTACKGCFFGE